MKKNIKKKNGFTMVELLIVIAIIGVLSALMMPNFVSIQDRAKEVSVKAIVLSVQNALENYQIDSGQYPNGSDLPISDLCEILIADGYLTQTPTNPFTGANYTADDTSGQITYSYDSNTGVYSISAVKRDGSTNILTVSNN